MAATETRLLLLGAVMLFEPVNGYQVRRELLSWGVDDWGHINPGSIYSGLATLTRQGHLERHDLVDGTRTVAVYTSTSSGRDELSRLARDCLERVEPVSSLPFHTALSLAPLLPRGRFLEHLRVRLERLDAAREQWYRTVDDSVPDSLPPHLPVILTLWRQLAEVERAWVQDLVLRVSAGQLDFAGEPASWAPPADDPGWQMEADRRRYRAALGLV
jgi:DNA-binding PadR family transcriptional regulator